MKQAFRAALRDARVVVISVVASVLLIGGTSATTLALSANHASARPMSTPKTGTVYSGNYAVYGGGNGFFMGTYIKLPKAMKYAITSDPDARSTVVTGSAFTADCPAVGKVHTTGWLCIYETLGTGHSTDIETYDPNTGLDTVGKSGFALSWTTTGGEAFSYGTWAIKVGSKSTAPSARTTPHRHAGHSGLN